MPTKMMSLAAAGLILCIAAHAQAGPDAGVGGEHGGDAGTPAPEPVRQTCLDDRFFVHVPTWASAEDVPADFGELLLDDLQAYADNSPLLQATSLTIAPVLPHRGETQPRADGHRRFWSVDTGIAIPESARCDWVDYLRERSSHWAQTSVYVGRECVAVGLSDAGVGEPDEPTPDSIWPLEMMGPVPAVSGDVDVVVIDSGFKADADWTPDGDLTTVDPGEDLLPHGAMVSALIEQITGAATGVELYDYRVLGPDGTAPLSDVALAIDEAVFNSDGKLVINLSLGWPPELERARNVPGCGTTLEDPAGEAVRYALLMAHLRDNDQLPGIGGNPSISGATAVVAAAGNRPVLFDYDVTPYYMAHMGVDDGPLAGDCSEPTDDGLFYPAQWARRETCLARAEATYTVPQLRILPVGAVDIRGQLSPLADAEMTPTLVAPGVGVWVDDRRWTGSSVSTAYAAGAMALQLVTSTDGYSAASAVINRAHPLQHLGAPAPRLLRFQAPQEPPFTADMPDAPAAPPTFAAGAVVGPVEIANCMSVLADWLDGTATAADVAQVCPRFMGNLDTYSAGEAGPQPPDIGCPECTFDVHVSAGKGDLHVKINETWPVTSTTISNPYLVISWPSGHNDYVTLPASAPWAPTEVFDIKDVPLVDSSGVNTLHDLRTKGSIKLVLVVDQQGTQFTDVSAVTINP